MLAFDLIGPLPVTDDENRYALVGLDLFSKRISAVSAPLTSKAANLVQCEIERVVFANPLLPKTILTDNGLEFSLVEKFCLDFNIRNSKSAPYHPQTNGAVERTNQTLKQRLFEVDGEQTWDQRLQRIVHAINSSCNHVTQLTPFRVETGFHGQNLFDQTATDCKPSDIRLTQEQALHRISREKTSRVQKNAMRDFVPFSTDELVLIKNHEKKWPRYIGPFRIIKVKGSGLSYDLSEVDGTRRFTRAVTELKPYQNRIPILSPAENNGKKQPEVENNRNLHQLDPDVNAEKPFRSGILLSDFFNFEDFPPLQSIQVQQDSDSNRNNPDLSLPTPSTTESELEQEGNTDTESTTSAESVIRRPITDSDTSTRSIIEIPTEDDWDPTGFQSQQIDSPENSHQSAPDASSTVISKEQLEQYLFQSSSDSNSNDAETSNSSRTSESTNFNSAEITNSPGTSTSASSNSTVPDVPQQEMIPVRRGRIRACKFAKEVEGKTVKINYKD